MRGIYINKYCVEKGSCEMASSRMKNKLIQALYKPGKTKSSSVMLKDIDALEKALEAAATGFKEKKEE